METPLSHRALLRSIARRAMLEKGLQPDFSPEALAEVASMHGPAAGRAGDHTAGSALKDLRQRAWCSIDNDDSRDLDQLSVADAVPGGGACVLVAIADVDALVGKGSALDKHAAQNTTSVYTPAEIFPMLPEQLSTDWTSLAFDADRRAMVVEMEIGPDGALRREELYPAWVRNRAKLAYSGVGAWLEGSSELPEAIAAVPGLEQSLRLQDEMAQRLQGLRHEHGALELELTEAQTVFDGDELKEVAEQTRNRAKDIIENLMIAANGATARFLAARKVPAVRRVVRTPKRWDRLVALAAEHGGHLPADPDPVALEQFLLAMRKADPQRFPDLSLSVVKLLGPGEYTVQRPGEEAAGHFGLAVRDYAHATAPNRRFADLVTQRLVKTALAAAPVPYASSELDEIARQCTEQEDDAKKVERLVEKSAAALLLQGRIGDQFDAIVTGASQKGTWARIFHPPVEGKVVRGEQNVDVGDRVRVRLLRTDVERGFIDFERIS